MIIRLLATLLYWAAESQVSVDGVLPRSHDLKNIDISFGCFCLFKTEHAMNSTLAKNEFRLKWKFSTEDDHPEAPA